MLTATAIVSVVAMSGWLFLNWRALQSHGLSFERKATYAAVWVVIFAVVAVIFSRLT